MRQQERVPVHGPVDREEASRELEEGLDAWLQ